MTVPNCTSKGGLDFSLQSPEFYSCIQLETLKPLVFTTMCPKEQQTNDNLTVEDNCFVSEIFDKYSFSGILRECLSHLNES